MKINVKKIETGKVGATSTHKLDEEVEITDTMTAPVVGQVVLTRAENHIIANFDITVNINIHWQEEDQETSRHQIPLTFTREYLLEAKNEEDTSLAIDNHLLDTNGAIVPEVKVNLPVQSFEPTEGEE
jgi:hypothetical protein